MMDAAKSKDERPSLSNTGRSELLDSPTISPALLAASGGLSSYQWNTEFCWMDWLR